MASRCSGLTYWPVKPEIAGSNPVGVATILPRDFKVIYE